MRISDWSSDVCSSDLLYAKCPPLADLAWALHLCRAQTQVPAMRHCRPLRLQTQDADSAITRTNHQENGKNSAIVKLSRDNFFRVYPKPMTNPHGIFKAGDAYFDLSKITLIIPTIQRLA